MPIRHYLAGAYTMLAGPFSSLTSFLVLVQLTRMLRIQQQEQSRPQPEPQVDDHSRWSITTLHLHNLHVHMPSQTQQEQPQAYVPAWPYDYRTHDGPAAPRYQDPFESDSSSPRVVLTPPGSSNGSAHQHSRSTPVEAPIGISYGGFSWFPGQPPRSRRPSLHEEGTSARLQEPWQPDEGFAGPSTAGPERNTRPMKSPSKQAAPLKAL